MLSTVLIVLFTVLNILLDIWKKSYINNADDGFCRDISCCYKNKNCFSKNLRIER